MKDKKILVVGGGYVGLHTAIKLSQYNNKVTVVELDQNKIDLFNSRKSPIFDSYMESYLNEYNLFKKIEYVHFDSVNFLDFNYIFISIATNPINDEAKLNTKPIFNLIEDVRKESKNIKIVLRSTINIDDAKKLDDLNVAYWPEFLQQGSPISKNINQDKNIISNLSKEDILEFLPSEEFKKTKLIGKTIDAILVKVFHNTLDAYLINLTNLFTNIAEENGGNFSNIGPIIEELLLKRPKVKKPGIGYGGSCYPKDSYSLIEITNNVMNRKLIQVMEDFNNNQYNWGINKIKKINNIGKILFLGISFKGQTNDLTRTPTKGIIDFLIRNNYDFKIWEPDMDFKYLEKFGIDLNYVLKDDLMKNKELIDEYDTVIVGSDWNVFKEMLDKPLENNKNIIDLKTYFKYI